MTAPFAAFSPTLFLRFLLVPLLLLQLAGLVHGAVEFHGEVTPGVHFIHGVHKAPVGWIVEVECKRNCRELDTRRWVFRSDVNTADSSRFVVNLTDAVAAAEFANEGVDLEVTVKSMRKLGGRFRENSWLLKSLRSGDLGKLHRFQLGHFGLSKDEMPSTDVGMYLSFQFTGTFDADPITKNQQKLGENLSKPLNRYAVQIDGYGKGTLAGFEKFSLLDGPVTLTEGQWTGKEEVKVKLGTHKNNIIQYLKDCKKPHIKLTVLTVPNVDCELCNGTNKKQGHLRRLPGCGHYYHNKCLMDLGTKGKGTELRRLKSAGDGGGIRDWLGLESGSTVRRPLPEAEVPKTVLKYSGDRVTTHKCPVGGCQKPFELKKHYIPGLGLKYWRDEVQFVKNHKLIETTLLEVDLRMPVLQNGEAPTYVYKFAPPPKDSKLWPKQIFVHNGGWEPLEMTAAAAGGVTELSLVPTSKEKSKSAAHEPTVPRQVVEPPSQPPPAAVVEPPQPPPAAVAEPGGPSGKKISP